MLKVKKHTKQICTKSIPSEMVKHRRQNWYEDHVHVVKTGGASCDRSFDMTEAPNLQVGHSLSQVISSECEEWQQR